MALGDMSAVARTCPVPRCASLQHLFHCLYLVLNDVINNCHEWRNKQLPLVVGYSVTCVLIGRHMTQSNPMDIPRLTQLPSFTYRSSFNHTCSLQYLCRSGITTRSYTAKSFHNTGRRMIRMIEYSETIPGRIFTYTIGSSHHRFQVDRCVLMRCPTIIF